MQNESYKSKRQLVSELFAFQGVLLCTRRISVDNRWITDRA